MQGVVGAGGNAFESMQKVMGDFAKYMPGHEAVTGSCGPGPGPAAWRQDSRQRRDSNT